MAIIRLPVSGDWVESALIVGVSAQELDGGRALVTVWFADFGEETSTLQVFTHIPVGTLSEAKKVRDAIAKMSDMDDDTDAGDSVATADGKAPKAAEPQRLSKRDMKQILAAMDPDDYTKN